MQKINIIFPAAHNSPNHIAPFYQKEAEAAEKAGFGISFAKDQNEAGEMTLSNNSSAEKFIYRGWIVRPAYYKELDKITNGKLMNSYSDYMSSYDFPIWYEKMEGETPHSIICSAERVRELGIRKIAEIASLEFDKAPIMIKDFLKSRKDHWHDACFIKDASDIEEIERVVNNFFVLQGRNFYGGIVFREFLRLRTLRQDEARMPFPLEYRTFFINEKPMKTMQYWTNELSYPENIEAPPEDWLLSIGKKLISPFVALDIAQDEKGAWWVIEVNDGGAAGFPEAMKKEEFYELLINSCF
jgi:ATP-grasp domain, R2K clade family 3